LQVTGRSPNVVQERCLRHADCGSLQESLRHLLLPRYCYRNLPSRVDGTLLKLISLDIKFGRGWLLKRAKRESGSLAIKNRSRSQMQRQLHFWHNSTSTTPHKEVVDVLYNDPELSNRCVRKFVFQLSNSAHDWDLSVSFFPVRGGG